MKKQLIMKHNEKTTLKHNEKTTYLDIASSEGG